MKFPGNPFASWIYKFRCKFGMHDWKIVMGFDATPSRIIDYNYHWKCFNCGLREQITGKNIDRLKHGG